MVSCGGGFVHCSNCVEGGCGKCNGLDGVDEVVHGLLYNVRIIERTMVGEGSILLRGNWRWC